MYTFFAIVSLTLLLNPVYAQEIYIKVNARNFARNHSIVEVNLPKNLASLSYKLVNEVTKHDAVVQQNAGGKLLFILPDALSPKGPPASYVSAYCLIDGGIASLTVFGFPSNLNYPQPIRVPLLCLTGVLHQSLMCLFSSNPVALILQATDI
ncbi:hypothetical protein GJU39_12715 [Pedobacter petrophilus]|uniref:Uncharacterized protein n=1 Tax=Pedobacter petrophilus TaxID=1908241 RepID=A0A7K0G153_9SPHI|nr:hypothetical protein [Pedobacter petrophilus]MRX76949.1 hypothetical protein [Pedobacter petrophilus]